MERKAGSQVTADKNLGYEMDSFLQWVFISRSLSKPSWVLGSGGVMDGHTWPLLSSARSLFPCDVQCQPLHHPPPQSSAKPTLLSPALQMSLREEMGGNATLFPGWRQSQRLLQEATHVVNMCSWASKGGTAFSICCPFLGKKSILICLWKETTSSPLQAVLMGLSWRVPLNS